MELFEYIKSQLPQMPNSAIMKQLGASQELIDYVKETPENTNFAIAEVIEGSGGGDEPEVWFVGNTGVEQGGMMTFELSNVGDTDYFTELVTNGTNYAVFLNGVPLPQYLSSGAQVAWCDAETPTMSIELYASGDIKVGSAAYMDASTAPTSVEVSVKTK